MRHARLLLDGMPRSRRGAVSWNALAAAGHSSMNSAPAALEPLRNARGSHVGVSGRFTYASVLAACGGERDRRSGKVAHALAVVSGLAPTAVLTNSVIQMYAKRRMIDEVRLVFDRAEERDESSWNLLLSAYVQMGWPEVAADVLVWMHRSEVKLDCFALGVILKACSELEVEGSKDVLAMVHGFVVKVCLDLGLFAGSAMADIYAENSGLEEAIKVFSYITSHDVVVYSAMIAGLAQLGNDPCPEVRIEAVKLFSDLLRMKVKPSKLLFDNVLEVCNLTNAVQCGRQIHAHVILNGFQDDEFIANALINLYSEARSVNDCLRCFHMTPKQDILTWTSMITAFAHEGSFEKALDLFTQLLFIGKEPDQFTVSSVMSACASLSLPTTCMLIHCYAVKSGLDRFTICGNSQISMYMNIGDLKASIKTFDQITYPDDFSLSAMVLSYAVHGLENEALVLFEMMKDSSVTINDSTFLSALIACAHCGLTEDGFRHYEGMISDYGYAPNMKHKACIVDLLGHVGKMDEAEDFIIRSGSENEPLLWHALLRACRIHGDKERGIQIGEKLMVLEPFAASSYVMMYNLYMDAVKISLAMRTRGLMRERGMCKEIGISWAEFQGSIHHFSEGDNSCTQNNAVWSRLEELFVRVVQNSKYGGNKIWGLGFQSQKVSESSISRHAELTAVAIGLSTLPSAAPVTVMKNQRISWESHETLKLLSEMENREIIVRDPDRFHRFDQGSCSCRDYW